MPFLILLKPAAVVQGDLADGKRIVEIGFMRIVEADVTVLPEPQKRNVDGRSREECGVTRAFQFDIGGVARQIVNCTGLNAIRDVLPDPATKTERVIGANAFVFVDVEYIYRLPIDIGHGRQQADHLQLRVGRREEDAGAALLENRRTNQRAGVASCLGCQRGPIWQNVDEECIGLKPADF